MFLPGFSMRRCFATQTGARPSQRTVSFTLQRLIIVASFSIRKQRTELRLDNVFSLILCDCLAHALSGSLRFECFRIWQENLRFSSRFLGRFDFYLTHLATMLGYFQSSFKSITVNPQF